MAEESNAVPLKLDKLSAWYGAAQALFDLEMEVGAGEVVGLLGRNGAGKSSTFKAIMNLGLRRTGTVSIGGEDMTNAAADTIARHGIAWVPEDRRIFTNLTVRENLRLAQFAAGEREPVQIDELVDTLPLLGKLIGRNGNQLSGGEQQLVAVARALASRPRILLLDEPTEGLAPKIVEGIAGSIARLPEYFHVTIVVAEQHLPFIINLTSRVYVLETGRVVHEGATADFAKDKDLQERYLSVSAGR